MAAENASLSRGAGGRTSSFNEAAANGRGKLVREVYRNPARKASMRPRRMAAENSSTVATARGSRTCFNEAAANGRGKRPRAAGGRFGAAGFNEAAANGRGKPRRVHELAHPQLAASMRPRRMAAENGLIG